TRAGLKPSADVFGQADRREDENARRRRSTRDSPRGFQAVDARHANVHEDDVGAKPLRDVDRLQPITGLSDDRDLRVDLEELAETRADQRLVRGDAHPNRQAPPGWSGSPAFPAKPPVLRPPASSVPPWSSIRSRIPTR